MLFLYTVAPYIICYKRLWTFIIQIYDLLIVQFQQVLHNCTIFNVLLVKITLLLCVEFDFLKLIVVLTLQSKMRVRSFDTYNNK